MQPRCFLLLADNPLTLAQLRAEIEDLGVGGCGAAPPLPGGGLPDTITASPSAACAAVPLGWSGRRAAGNFATAGVVLRASSARAGGGTPAGMHRTGTSAADGAGDAADAPGVGIPAGNGGADSRASTAADRRDARPIPADGAPRAADPVRRRASAAARYRIDMESRRLRCDCALLRPVGRPRTRQAHESGVFVSIAGAIDAQREEDGEEGGVRASALSSRASSIVSAAERQPYSS